jgi:hypothetical protein
VLPSQILHELWVEDVRLFASGERLTAWPASRSTDHLRHLIRDHKPALLAFMEQAQASTGGLVEAAIRACDHHGDKELQRSQMRQACIETPLHLRADLESHFKRLYPRI